MKQPKPTSVAKPRKLPKAALADLASSIHAALALAHATGEPLPKRVTQRFYAVLEAELDAVLPPGPAAAGLAAEQAA